MNTIEICPGCSRPAHPGETDDAGYHPACVRAVGVRTHAALTSLDRALRRYERLASPPRHLQIPLVGDLDDVAHAARQARRRGDVERADVLADWCEREWTRQQALACWPGRSRVAWVALRERLARAADWAHRTGTLTPTARLLAADRIRAIEHEIHCHDVNDTLAALN